MQEKPNPFYVLLVIVGICFTVTACAYGVMIVRDLRPGRPSPASASSRGLLRILDHYGAWILLAEVAALALTSFAAMATDDYWSKRALSESAAAAADADSSAPPGDSEPPPQQGAKA